MEQVLLFLVSLQSGTAIPVEQQLHTPWTRISPTQSHAYDVHHDGPMYASVQSESSVFLPPGVAAELASLHVKESNR